MIQEMDLDIVDFRVEEKETIELKYLQNMW